ncbi:mobilization protein [Aeromonas hydrophila]|uniref:MbeD/MobD family mobilization/exclusion protein n=1 Tax=Aeromonas hydrophila TaxID=644 RepID=UPI0021F4F73B|nr:MbeD/MobD family mobilization/exclusion protein [Aeromonas hydrophila]MCV9384959.1 mobilization protein [Aeromonas hydrophila]
MTELERHLLNALETLQSEQEQQWRSLQTACDSLLRQFETTKKENASLQGEVRALRQQCEHLSKQVSSLATQVASLKA